MSFDVVVLGAGAAGMMCAARGGQARGRRVLLLEHGEKVGRKILISGGGRCNFTNIHTKAENFLSENPHFAKSALARYTPKDFVALVEKHGIAVSREDAGAVVLRWLRAADCAMLERECAEAKVETRCGVSVWCGATEFFIDGFEVETSVGSFACEAVVVATGGLSIPKMGATGVCV
jgi:predicted Rossmann fold flavoprotein